MGVDSAGTTQALVATATTPDTYSMESEAAETTQAVADSLEPPYRTHTPQEVNQSGQHH